MTEARGGSLSLPNTPTAACQPGRIFVAACLAALLCLSVPVGVAGGQPADDDTLEWLDDYQAALALAQETGRPLLVEFRCVP